MTLLAPLRGRAFALSALCMAQALASAALASVGTVAIARPLYRHPDGVWAIFSDNGRLALDLYRLHGPTLDLALGVTLGAVLLWAVLWMLLGGVLPALFTPRAPSLRESVAYSVRRAPTLMALASMVALSLLIACCVGYFGESWATRRAARMHSTRDRDLLHLAMLAPSFFLFALSSVWHDLARVSAVGKNLRALGAASDALVGMLRSPWWVMSRASGYALLGGCGPLVALCVALATEHRRALWAVGFLCFAQQSALVWKSLCRALWIARLSAPRE